MTRGYWVLKACELIAIMAVFFIASPIEAWQVVALIPAVVAVNMFGWVEGKYGPWGREVLPKSSSRG